MAKKKARKIKLSESANPFEDLRYSIGGSKKTDSKNDDFDPDAKEVYEERDLEEFSITAEVEAILNDKSIVARDMKIDDSSMSSAKSYWDWVTDPQYLGEHVSPYLEQALIGIKLFGEFCVVKGSYIYTDNGMMRIEDYVGNPREVGMHSMSSKVVSLKGKKLCTYGGMTSKRRKCIKLSFASGASVTVTPEHQVLVLTEKFEYEWKEARNLNIGDYGIQKFGESLFANKSFVLPDFVSTSGRKYFDGRSGIKKFPKKMSNEFARFIGYVISDGSIDTNYIRFTNVDVNLIDDFVLCCKKCFGYDANVSKPKRKETSLQDYFEVNISSGALVEYLAQLGLSGKSYRKVIPDCVLQSTKNHNVECVRAIMDCDGSINEKRLTITLRSVECVKQIALILQNLGIQGKYEEFSGTYHPVGDYRNNSAIWSSVNSSSREIYADVIGSKHFGKNLSLSIKKAEEAYASNSTGNVRLGAVPHGKDLYSYASQLRKTYHEKGLLHSKYGRRDTFSIESVLSDPDFVTFWKSKDCSILKRLSEIQKDNVSVSQLVKVEDAGYHEVYDITVPDGENFVCNGLVVHNCPHCSDTNWMLDENHGPTEGLDGIRKHVVCLEYGVCPKCGGHRSQLFKDGELAFYNELAVNAGQRSGKSIVVALISTYITHRVLMMQKPTEIYNVGPNQMLHGTFVALTAGQAKDTLWEPYYGYILESPWFKKYHALLDHYQQKYKQTVYKVMDSYILYRHRNLFVHYAGPDKRVLRGRTRIFASIDEIGWFDNSKDSGKVKIDASEVYIALERSLLTCRAAEQRQLNLEYDMAMSAYFLNISSPSSVRDKICELVRLSEGSTKLLGLHKPTWEMNPNVPKDSDIIQEAYRKDPVTADRDYGANPPLSSNPFIRSKSMVMDCAKEKGKNFIRYQHKIYRAKDGSKYRYALFEKARPSSEPSIMAIDAGLTNNSFAMAVGTKSGGIINLDVLIEVMPLPGIPLHYTKIYEELIVPTINARNVRILLADRWNSVKLLQDAEADIERLQLAKSYSVKYSDLWNTKVAIESNILRYPRPSEIEDVDAILGFDPDDYPRCFQGKEAEHLILQMLTVQDTGKQVIKGENLTDDLWRATVLLQWGLTNPDFEEYMVVDEGNKYKAGIIGKVRKGLSNGSSSSSKTNVKGTKFLAVRSSRK